MPCQESHKKNSIGVILILKIKELDKNIEAHVEAILDEFEDIYQD
jgi:hypothetical protein